MFRIVLKLDKQTRNYAKYVDVSNEINKLYLPKGLDDMITLVLVDSEVAHLLNPEPTAPRSDMGQ